MLMIKIRYVLQLSMLSKVFGTITKVSSMGYSRNVCSTQLLVECRRSLWRFSRFYTYCQSDNSTLEKLIYNGMYHQAGENYNYIPSNQSMTEGNDDQGVWGMAIMEAVERNFTEPESHSWLEMVQAVFNTMNARWDADNCGGGLRWQILPGILVMIIRIQFPMVVFSI